MHRFAQKEKASAWNAKLMSGTGHDIFDPRWAESMNVWNPDESLFGDPWSVHHFTYCLSMSYTFLKVRPECFPAVKRNPESPEAASTMFDNEASTVTQEIIDEDELSRVSSKSASWWLCLKAQSLQYCSVKQMMRPMSTNMDRARISIVQGKCFPSSRKLISSTQFLCV